MPDGNQKPTPNRDAMEGRAKLVADAFFEWRNSRYAANETFIRRVGGTIQPGEGPLFAKVVQAMEAGNDKQVHQLLKNRVGRMNRKLEESGLQRMNLGPIETPEEDLPGG